MKIITNALSLAVLTMLAPTLTFAFEINPIDADCWGRNYLCVATKKTERVKSPVHETMTLLAYDFRNKPESSRGGVANTSAEELRQNNRLRDLELGAEWNDDPDSLLRNGITKTFQWYALFKDAKKQAECRDIPSKECTDVPISSNPMMLYRSHFGNMQFLHSMASTRNEKAGETKSKIMAWAKFTYNLYISGEKVDHKALSDYAEIDSIINKPGWTVGALFNPVPGGEWKRSKNPLKFGRYIPNGKPRKQNKDDISVRHIALGSLLHMIQDTYADSHVAREKGCNPLNCSNGKITAFRNYSDQNADEHAIADAYPVWLRNGELSKDNAVWASAKLIGFAFDQAPWETLEKFLDTEVLALSDPEAKPNPGDKGCYTGTGI